MPTLSFSSKSQKFEYAVSLIKELGGEFDGVRAYLDIPDDKVIYVYEKLLDLLMIVGNWKTTVVESKGKTYNGHRFLFQTGYVIRNCYERCKSENNCGKNSQGWGCVMIGGPSYYLSGKGNYKSGYRYWYNFGKFIGDKWVIDKEALLDKLKACIENSFVDYCPLFDFKWLVNRIYNLPDYIIPDDIKFRIFSKESYINGQKIMCPVNIRHIDEPQTHLYNSLGDKIITKE